MELFLITLLFLILGFVGLSFRIIFKKDGEFPGTCASNINNEGNEACSVCGKRNNEDCNDS
jgi:hypothetical protein